MNSLVLLAFGILLSAKPNPKPDLVDLEGLHQNFRFDMRYATKDNFFGQVAYPEGRCILRRSAAQKMVEAQNYLDQNHPGLSLYFKDCYRPNHVQHILWKAVVGTPKARYVANPNTKTGSIHSYGAAVDLTLTKRGDKEIDMGTEYDHLGKLAEPRHEKQFLKEGKLTKNQLDNRKILYRAMKKVGMKRIPNEWWHYNEFYSKIVRKKYQRLDIPFSAVPKNKPAEAKKAPKK